MQGIFHTIFKWAHWIFVLAIVMVVIAYLTIPVVQSLLGAVVSFIAFLFNPLGLTILRKAAELISNIDVTP